MRIPRFTLCSEFRFQTARFLVGMGVIASLASCAGGSHLQDDDGSARRDIPSVPETLTPTDGVAGDASADTDWATDADGGNPPEGLRLELDRGDGGACPIVVQLTPVEGDGVPLRYETTDGVLDLPDLPPGRYGLFAWCDEDRNGRFDGIWAGQGEPSAQMGVVVPRRPLAVALHPATEGCAAGTTRSQEVRGSSLRITA